MMDILFITESTSLFIAAAEFVRLTEALEVLLDTAARVCNFYDRVIAILHDTIIY